MADKFTLRDYRSRVLEIIGSDTTSGSHKRVVLKRVIDAKSPLEMVEAINGVLSSMKVSERHSSELAAYKGMIAENRPLQG